MLLDYYKSYKKNKISFSELSEKDKNSSFGERKHAAVTYLAFDEVLYELSFVKQKNQELEAKLDKIIQLLEAK